ncbi:MAG: DUF1109 domain-containing protein [Rubellimicrobium sp.]|nr:DUF1109 domain-containing protein [Rubellimicrobium sp.]
MKTDDLIMALSQDTRPAPGVAKRLVGVLPVALFVTLAAFVLVWGVRPDLAGAMTSPAVLKSVVPLVLAGLAGTLALTLSRPEAQAGRGAIALGIIGAVLAGGFVVALGRGGVAGLVDAMSPPSLLTCLVSIPALSLPLVAAALWSLSAGAPRRPAMVGALGGLSAGALGASVYALYCDQDAALFVLPAYAAAILIVSLVGMLAGKRVLAW